MPHSHLCRRLVIAATTAVAVGAGATPALAAVSPHTTRSRSLKSEIKVVDSTPLGRAIERQDTLTRIDLSSFDSADIPRFTANRTACEKAEAAVRAVTPEPSGHQAEVKREWLKGEQYQAMSDQLFADSLRAHGTESEQITAARYSSIADGLTGWAFNALASPNSNPRRVPRR